MFQPQLAPVPKQTRKNSILLRLKESFSQMTGIALEEMDENASFLEMGADSLFLLRASQAVQDEFGVKTPFRMMFDEIASLDALASYIDQHLPSEEFPTTVKEAAPDGAPSAIPSFAEVASHPLMQPTAVSPAPDPIMNLPDDNAFDNEESSGLSAMRQGILTRQLQVMSEQLELLRSLRSVNAHQPISERAAEAPYRQNLRATEARIDERQTSGTAVIDSFKFSDRDQANGKALNERPEVPRFAPYQAIKVKRGSAGGLSSRQRERLSDLIQRVVERTLTSKRIAQDHRQVLADNRATAGFNLLWKEMQYPLIVQRAQNARLWDVDGHQYIDLTMGFGALLFGHSPPFLTEALQTQISRGLQLGAESPLAAKNAALICELTGVERATFCNSGTEAVMSALRLARTVTGRDRIALFEGCYHGAFDGVMVRPERDAHGNLRPAPAAPGVPKHMIEKVTLLSYNDPHSLEFLQNHSHELAAVLVEPLPSRFPDSQPRAFLQALRRVTSDAGAALIFDEVITGFRLHPGGAQALFGVQADIVAYGKAIGAGLPVSVVAGKRAFLDAIDGGNWSYGDQSYPRAETTFFAGTFFKHPLLMAPVWAVLNQIKSGGLKMYAELEQRTSQLAKRLNDYFEEEKAPIRVVSFGSLFRFLPVGEVRFMDLFYYHLLEQGVFICETRSCFLSTAHTDEDLAQVIEAVKQSVAAMRAGDFLP
jgi:glutamate-1-semialdehyde-2,1-aminomutase